MNSVESIGVQGAPQKLYHGEPESNTKSATDDIQSTIDPELKMVIFNSLNEKLENDYQKGGVVITGFGPFNGHPINASAEVAKFLAGRTLADNDSQSRILSIQIPVAYAEIAQIIPELWERYDPNIMVHIGVAKEITSILLEQQAANGTVEGRIDIKGCCPGSCPIDPRGDCQFLTTKLDLNNVCHRFNEEKADLGIAVAVSQDAGRYLCNYSYFHSLAHDPSRSVFIHVPPLSDSCSLEQLGDAVFRIVQMLMDQINGNEK